MSETKQQWKIKESLQVAGVVFLIVLIYAMLCLTAKAQIAPIASYQFNNPTPLNATTGGFNISNPSGVPVSYGTGPVGQYMTRGGLEGAILSTPSFNPGSNLSVQFLFRVTRDFQKYRGALALKVGNFSIYFAYPNVILQNDTGQTLFPLNQVGKVSWQNIQDGNWHMISVTYAPASGQRRLYIDGQSPAEFSASSIPYPLSNAPMYVCGIGALFDQFTSDFDELYIYNGILSPNQVWQNYLDFQAGNHFTTAVVATVPPYSPTTAGVNPLEYQSGNYVPDVQLDTFPYPRYKPIYIGTDSFPPTLNFSDPTYLGGHALSWQPNLASEISTAWKVAYRLCNKFNWAVPIYDWRAGNFPCTDSVNSFFGKMVALANRYPQFKSSTITNFLLTPNGGGVTTSSGGNQGFNGNQYVKNGAGLYWDWGIPGGGYSASPILKEGRPSITKAQSIDGNHFADNNYSPDIAWYHTQAATLNTALTRPLDYNVDNNEGWTEQDPSIYTNDPVIGPNITASGLSARSFVSRYVARYWTNYQDSIFRVGYADLLNVKTSNYQMGGNPTYFYKWSEMRNVAITYRGQKLATMDYYPLYPGVWYHESGANHGFRFMMDCDAEQYAAGDRFMSNFVSPGWNVPETTHTSCVQFLGEMKDLVVKGNVTFYVSMFNNVVGGPNQPDVKDWIHSQVIPCYALATGTRMERIMHHGYCMDGDLPLVPTDVTGAKRKQFYTGDFRSYCVVRKDSLSNKYAIGINFNRNSNMVGNTPDSTISTITLGGQSITMTSHQKGDIYIYDNTDASNPVFYPLDEWHENKHPLYWSSDFRFQAEVNDNYDPQQPVQLKTTVVGAANNYVNATTYISYKDTTTVLDSVRYIFTPTVAGTYYVWIRLKSRTGTATGLKIRLNTGTVYTLPVSSSTWSWYRYDNGTVVAPGINYSLTANVPQHLSIIANDKYIEIDQIVLTKTANAGYPETFAPCLANITASGATTFCQPGSVTLTANISTNYLWSTGATTQSIVVSTSGTYVVTTTDASACTAVSGPVVVAANALPAVPVITALGPTTFCTGGSVDLQSSVEASYLWSNGSTLQTINITTSGVYTVTVTNAAGCTRVATVPITVTVNTLPGIPVITPAPGATVCALVPFTLTSSAATSYQWSTGATTQVLSLTFPNSLYGPWSYVVTVTNAAGCTRSSATFVQTILQLPIVAALTPVINICPAVTFDLSTLTLVNTGEPITVLSYHATLADAQNNVFPIAAVVAATGTYYIRCQTAAGCYAVVSQAVSIVACACVNPPLANAGPDQNICDGTTATMAGSISGTATVGTWTTSGTGTFTPSATTLNAVYTPSAADTVAGTVTLTLTTNNPSGAPCVADANSMLLTLVHRPSGSVTPSGTTTFCTGGSIAVQVTNIPSASYLWSNGITTQGQTISTAGSYYCVITNLTGCSSGKTNTITVVVNGRPAQPTISPSGAQVICSGSSITLTSSVKPAGGAYLWSTGATTQSISVSTAGSYRVTVSNVLGCTRSSNAKTVTVSTLATPVITASGSTILCGGSSVTLTSSAGTSYLWSNGETTQSVTTGAVGTYAVTVTSGACTAMSMPIMVTSGAGSPVTISNSAGSTNICSGIVTTLTAVTGVVSPTYLWSTGQSSASINTGVTGTYTVTVTQTNGCSSVASISLFFYPPIISTITANGPTTFCQGGTVTLAADPGYTYLWSNGLTIQSILVSTFSNYSVVITNAVGCTNVSNSILVSVNALPVPITFSVTSPANICPGQSAVVVASSSANCQYLWSDGTTTNTLVTNVAGVYTATATDVNGCSRISNPMVITTGNPPVPTITASGPTTFCVGTTLSLTASSGSAYLWSNGSTSQVIFPPTSDTYTVTVTDAFGCSNTSVGKSVTVLPLPPVAVTPSGSLTFCVNGAVGLCANSGSGYSYLWSNAATYRCITAKTANTWSVTVTDANGCKNTSALITTFINPTCTINCTGIPFGMTVTDIRVYQATQKWADDNCNDGYKAYLQKIGQPKTRRKPVDCTVDKRDVIWFQLKPGVGYEVWLRGNNNGILTDSVPAIRFTTLIR